MRRRKGDKIYDAEGKYICRLAIVPISLRPIKINDFDDWQVEKPRAGDPIHPAIADYAKVTWWKHYA
jgi:hypothetical protein